MISRLRQHGIQAFDAYLERISPKTQLPCKKSETMESAFDYIRSVSLVIDCRQSMLDLPVEIAEDAELDSIVTGSYERNNDVQGDNANGVKTSLATS